MNLDLGPLALFGRAKRITFWIFSGSLSLALFLAIVLVLKSLGFEYNLGYDVHAANAIMFSSQLDPVIWQLTTLGAGVTAPLLGGEVWLKSKLRWALSFAAVVEVGLYANNLAVVGYSLSLLLGVGLIAANVILAGQYAFKKRCSSLVMVFAGLLFWGVIVEALASASRFLGLFPNVLPPGVLLSSQGLQDELSGFLFSYCSVLMLSAIFAWILALPLIFARPKHSASPKSMETLKISQGRWVPLTMLGFGIVLGIFVPLAPYLGAHELRGVDTSFYYQRLFSTPNLGSAVSLIGVEPREPYVILLYLIQRLTGWDPLRVTIFGPALLGAFFAIAAFLLMNELTKDGLTAGGAALLSGSSLHVAIGLYGGIFANWLALSAVLLFFYFLQKSLAKPSWGLTLLTTAASYGALLMHVWTWIMMLFIVLVGLVLMSPILFSRRKPRRLELIRTRSPVIFLSASPLLLAAVGDSVGIFPGSISALASGPFTVLGDIASVRYVYQALTFSMRYYVGALFSYPLVLILSALGAISMALSYSGRARLPIAWLFATSIITILVQSWFQWRVLYLVPFELLASVGITSILRILDRIIKINDRHDARILTALKILFVAVILLDFVNYGLRATTLLQPSG